MNSYAITFAGISRRFSQNK